RQRHRQVGRRAGGDVLLFGDDAKTVGAQDVKFGDLVAVVGDAESVVAAFDRIGRHRALVGGRGDLEGVIGALGGSGAVAAGASGQEESGGGGQGAGGGESAVREREGHVILRIVS